MGSADRHTFLDRDGSPLDARIQSVLHLLRPRFRRRLPRLDDDVFVTEIFEEAGQRIAAHEGEHGRAENLEAFAWTTLLNVARSRVVRSSMRLVEATLGPDASDAVLRTLQAQIGTPEQIETDILVQQILTHLSPEERDLYYCKAWGYSSRKIARALGTSEGNVNTLVYRMRQKIRELLHSTNTEESALKKPQSTKPRTR